MLQRVILRVCSPDGPSSHQPLRQPRVPQRGAVRCHGNGPPLPVSPWLRGRALRDARQCQLCQPRVLPAASLQSPVAGDQHQPTGVSFIKSFSFTGLVHFHRSHCEEFGCRTFTCDGSSFTLLFWYFYLLTVIYTNISLCFQIATDEDSGVLLYKGDNDHIAMELYRGRLRVSYDTGSYPPSAIYRYVHAQAEMSNYTLTAATFT